MKHKALGGVGILTVSSSLLGIMAGMILPSLNHHSTPYSVLKPLLPREAGAHGWTCSNSSSCNTENNCAGSSGTHCHKDSVTGMCIHHSDASCTG
jgi:hypothetical protein